MKELICYQCETCKEIYKNKQKALDCEHIGKESKLANIGDILTYKHNVSGFELEVKIKIIKIIDRGHYNVYKFMVEAPNGKWAKELYGVSEMVGNEEFLKRTNTI